MAPVFDVERIAGRSFGVAGVELHSEFHTTKTYLLLILEAFINFHGRVPGKAVRAKAKIRLAAALKQRGFRLCRLYPCSSEAFHFREGGNMIPVTVRSQQDFYVRKPETQVFNVGQQLRDRIRQTGIDQNISLRSSDQITGEIPGPHIIDIADDAEWGKRFCPVR